MLRFMHILTVLRELEMQPHHNCSEYWEWVGGGVEWFGGVQESPLRNSKQCQKQRREGSRHPTPPAVSHTTSSQPHHQQSATPAAVSHTTSSQSHCHHSPHCQPGLCCAGVDAWCAVGVSALWMRCERSWCGCEAVGVDALWVQLV